MVLEGPERTWLLASLEQSRHLRAITFQLESVLKTSWARELGSLHWGRLQLEQIPRRLGMPV
jgi:hypothetical protein